MTEAAKTRPTVGAVGRALETEAPYKLTTASTTNYTRSVADRQFQIADLLHPGAENAVPRRDLMAWTGLSDRMLRRQIESERRAGIPILSDNIHGYWISDNPAEIKRFSRSMRRRAAEIWLTAMCVEKSAEV